MSADTEADTLQSVNADMHQLTQATVTLTRGKSYQSLLFFVFTQPDGKLITNISEQIRHLNRLLLDGWAVVPIIPSTEDEQEARTRALAPVEGGTQ